MSTIDRFAPSGRWVRRGRSIVLLPHPAAPGAGEMEMETGGVPYLM